MVEILREIEGLIEENRILRAHRAELEDLKTAVRKLITSAEEILKPDSKLSGCFSRVRKGARGDSKWRQMVDDLVLTLASGGQASTDTLKTCLVAHNFSCCAGRLTQFRNDLRRNKSIIEGCEGKAVHFWYFQPESVAEVDNVAADGKNLGDNLIKFDKVSFMGNRQQNEERKI